jgi:hypothetical protein
MTLNERRMPSILNRDAIQELPRSIQIIVAHADNKIHIHVPCICHRTPLGSYLDMLGGTLLVLVISQAQ